MDMRFPVILAWQRTQAGVRAPAMCHIDGKQCLAVFQDYGKVVQFYQTVQDAVGEKDDTEECSARAFKMFTISCPYIALNPGSDEQAVYAGAEVRAYIDQLEKSQ